MGSLAEEDPENIVDDRDGFAAWASIISSRIGAAVDTGDSANTDGGRALPSSIFSRCGEREVEKECRIVSSGSTVKLLSSLSFHTSSSSSRTT